MRKVATIALTECLNTLLSKGFLLAVLMTPIFIGGSMIVQSYIKERVDTADRTIAVLDWTGQLYRRLDEAAAKRNEREIFIEVAGIRRQTGPRFVLRKVPPEPSRDQPRELSDQVRDNRLFGYIVVQKGVVEGEEGARITYHTQTHTFTDLPRWLHETLTEILREMRIADTGVEPELARRIAATAPLKWRGLVEVDQNGVRHDPSKVDLKATFGVPAVAMLLLFVLVFMSVPMLLHSVIEEKQQRIWEVLVSSVTPFQLLLGKLFGTVLVSMMLSGLYLGGAALFARQMEVADKIPAMLYVWFLLFQLLALLIYGSMFSAIGAACSELRDAQSLMMPAMLLIIIPMFGWVAILRAPDSAFSSALSLFPPATPMLMMLRISLPPGPAAWEIALAIVLTSAFTLLCVWAAGKIFRVGILAQGQTPTLGRLLSWILAK